MATKIVEDSNIAILSGGKTLPIVDTDSDDGMLSTYSLPTLPELAQRSQESSSLLTRSQYALVVFHGVADTYPTDSDILCRYSLTDGVEATPGDRVVLFAVGWSSITDYIVFEWAPIPEKDEKDFTVVFKAVDLPKDVNEFYQVCYVSNEGQVCGASVPFQVRTPNNEELTCALEEDMVIVRSSTAVAQDKLLKAQLDRENLNKEKVNLEKQLRSLEEKHNFTLRRLDRLQETLSTSNTLNEELKKENTNLSGVNEQMLCMKEKLKVVESKLGEVEQEKKKLQKDLEVSSVKIIHAEKHAQELDKELSAATIVIQTWREERNKSHVEIKVVRALLEQTQSNRAAMAAMNCELVDELKLCKSNLENAQSENLRLESELKNLAQENTKLNEHLRISKKLDGTNQCKQNTSFDNRGDRFRIENMRLQQNLEDFQLRVSTLEHENHTLQQILVDTLDAQKNSCVDHCSLEKDVAQLQYRLNEATIRKERARESVQGSSSNHETLALLKKVETLEEVLEDSLKENQIRLQEKTALQIQNEMLETELNHNTKLEEYVIVTTSNASGPVPVIDLTEETEDLRQKLFAQQQLFAESAEILTKKDQEILKLHDNINTLNIEKQETNELLRLEIANLVSKNASFLDQEVQLRELKNEMQRIRFVNEEMMIQNASLLERLHGSKLYTDEKFEPRNPELCGIDKTFEIENKHLTEKLEYAHEELSAARKQLETVTLQLEECRKDHGRLQNELHDAKTIRRISEKSYLQRPTESGVLSPKLDMDTSEVYPKLDEISRSVVHVLSAVEKLSSHNEVKRDERMLKADELKYRLELAREEYEKLYAKMNYYKTKYNNLKTKYKMQKSASDCDTDQLR